MDSVRSAWEEGIEEYIKRKYPALRIESNNRTVIPSRRTRSFNLEIDIFIPQLCLGIEANGDPYHNREKYLNDQLNGTAYSDEMYKEDYCRRVGIELIHVWTSEDPEAIQLKIDDAIQRRLNDPTVQEWHESRPSNVASCLGWLMIPLAFLGLGVAVLGGLSSAVSVEFLLVGGDGSRFFSPTWILPSLLAGAIGVCAFCLASVGDALLSDSTRNPPTSCELFEVLVLGLGFYVSWILLGIGALTIFFLWVLWFNDWSPLKYSRGLVVGVSAGLIGLFLHRFLNRERP